MTDATDVAMQLYNETNTQTAEKESVPKGSKIPYFIIPIIILIIITAVLVYYFARGQSPISPGSTTTIPPQALTLSSAVNGAQVSNVGAKMLADTGYLEGSWIIMFNTTSPPYGTSTDMINYTLVKNGSTLSFNLTKQTVSSPVGVGQHYTYSGSYNGSVAKGCIGSPGQSSYLCDENTTQLNSTLGTAALLGYLNGPITEDTSRLVSAPGLYIFPTPYNSSVSYTFVNYSTFNGNPCALMDFRFGPTAGAIGVLGANVSAHGSTCISTSFGLPLYTNVEIKATNSSTMLNTTINGSLEATDVGTTLAPRTTASTSTLPTTTSVPSTTVQSTSTASTTSSSTVQSSSTSSASTSTASTTAASTTTIASQQSYLPLTFGSFVSNSSVLLDSNLTYSFNQTGFSLVRIQTAQNVPYGEFGGQATITLPNSYLNRNLTLAFYCMSTATGSNAQEAQIVDIRITPQPSSSNGGGNECGSTSMGRTTMSFNTSSATITIQIVMDDYPQPTTQMLWFNNASIST